MPIVIEVMGKKMDSQVYVDTNIVKRQIVNFFFFLGFSSVTRQLCGDGVLFSLAQTFISYVIRLEQ